MPKATMIIKRSDADVYEYLLNELGKTLNKDTNKLLNFKKETVFNSNKGKKTMIQHVLVLDKPSKLSFSSQVDEDSVLTTYLIEAKSETSSKLTLIEKATSTAPNRRLNYGLFSMPIFRIINTRQLKQKVNAIKEILETK